MITIDFFFLCRPGEHTVTFDNEPFKLSNVQFYQHDEPIPILSSELLPAADFQTLTFDTQKNSVKGEHIGRRCCTSAYTQPHPSCSPLGSSPRFTQGKARLTIVLLLPYSKQDLPISCIPRHHASSLCVSPTSPTFLCQPSFYGVPLSMY